MLCDERNVMGVVKAVTHLEVTDMSAILADLFNCY